MSHRASYLKTIGMCLALAVASMSCAVVLVSSWTSLAWAEAISIPFFAMGMGAMVVCSGGLVCWWREVREAAGKPDLIEPLANWEPGPRHGYFSKLGAGAPLGTRLRPGDLVEVRSLEEIESTLDDQGQLEALPFMEEMKLFCGKVLRVHRRLEKINDMRNKTGLRRMRHSVTLSGIRCAGYGHGGCQAECQLVWKDAWLRRLSGRHEEPTIPRQRSSECNQPEDENLRYVCQMTRLWEASESMPASDPRQDLRAVLAGNIALRAFVIAMLTRLFNRVQRIRGGAGYPVMPDSPTEGRTPAPIEHFGAGAKVVIRSKAEIAKTIVRGRNRGLWYDRDMIRYSGRSGVVRKQVGRVIDERTGKMVVMKTPCVMLEGVVGTGEFLRFCSQHEYILWREVWLRKA